MTIHRRRINAVTPPPKYKHRIHTISIEAADHAFDFPRVDDSAMAARISRAIFQRLNTDRENFVVLALSSRGQITGYHCVATGTLSHVLTHPREIFKSAILLSAASIIVVHNHPSGDPTPSPEDLSLTHMLERAGDLLQIPLHDHLVIGQGERYVSIYQWMAARKR